jgi:hypothetical protein
MKARLESVAPPAVFAFDDFAINDGAPSGRILRMEFRAIGFDPIFTHVGGLDNLQPTPGHGADKPGLRRTNRFSKTFKYLPV